MHIVYGPLWRQDKWFGCPNEINGTDIRVCMIFDLVYTVWGPFLITRFRFEFCSAPSDQATFCECIATTDLKETGNTWLDSSLSSEIAARQQAFLNQSGECLEPESKLPIHWRLSPDLELCDYQKQGVNFVLSLHSRSGGILADDVFFLLCSLKPSRFLDGIG